MSWCSLQEEVLFLNIECFCHHMQLLHGQSTIEWWTPGWPWSSIQRWRWFLSQDTWTSPCQEEMYRLWRRMQASRSRMSKRWGWKPSPDHLEWSKESDMEVSSYWLLQSLLDCRSDGQTGRLSWSMEEDTRTCIVLKRLLLEKTSSSWRLHSLLESRMSSSDEQLTWIEIAFCSFCCLWQCL